jgi:hypothetical protein
MLNAAINSPEAKQFWAVPGWLPEEIGIIIDQGQLYCYQGDDLKLHIQRGIHNIAVYSLIGLAADINSGQHQKSHLVSLVNGMCSSVLNMFVFIGDSCTFPASCTIRKPMASVQRFFGPANQV